MLEGLQFAHSVLTTQGVSDAVGVSIGISIGGNTCCSFKRTVGNGEGVDENDNCFKRVGEGEGVDANSRICEVSPP